MPPQRTGIASLKHKLALSPPKHTHTFPIWWRWRRSKADLVLHGFNWTLLMRLNQSFKGPVECSTNFAPVPSLCKLWYHRSISDLLPSLSSEKGCAGSPPRLCGLKYLSWWAKCGPWFVPHFPWSRVNSVNPYCNVRILRGEDNKCQIKCKKLNQFWKYQGHGYWEPRSSTKLLNLILVF